MTLGHLNADGVLPFRPTGKGGGSKKGKPQGRWPWVMKIALHAIIIRAKGTSDAWKIDRRYRLTLAEMKVRLDAVLPGWEEYAREHLGYRKTSYIELLANRVYKMYYSGTSDRGRGHDPQTRACESREHWSKHHAATSPLGRLHERIERGEVCVPDWRSYL